MDKMWSLLFLFPLWSKFSCPEIVKFLVSWTFSKTRKTKAEKRKKVYAEKRNVLEKLVRKTFPRLFLTTYSLPFSYVVACSSTANWLNRRNFSAWEIWESLDSSLRRSGFGGNFSWTVPSSARLKFHLINLTSAPYPPPYPHPSSSWSHDQTV